MNRTKQFCRYVETFLDANVGEQIVKVHQPACHGRWQMQRPAVFEER
jgi:hypothetical protein